MYDGSSREMVEGFLVGTVAEIMAEFRIKLSRIFTRVSLDLLGYLFQGGEMSRGVSISEGMVGDDVKALTE
jgi:hypothetical protein